MSIIQICIPCFRALVTARRCSSLPRRRTAHARRPPIGQWARRLSRSASPSGPSPRPSRRPVPRALFSVSAANAPPINYVRQTSDRTELEQLREAAEVRCRVKPVKAVEWAGARSRWTNSRGPTGRPSPRQSFPRFPERARARLVHAKSSARCFCRPLFASNARTCVSLFPGVMHALPRQS